MKKTMDLLVGEQPGHTTSSMYWDGKAIDSPYLFITVDESKTVAGAGLEEE